MGFGYMGKEGILMDPDNLRAAPGWVWLRRLKPIEEKSAGGILLQTNEDNNPSLVAQGEVIDSGIYKDKRTGRMSFKAGWLPKGSIVQFIPHNPWSATGVGSRDIVGAYSDDIMSLPEDAKLEPISEDAPAPVLPYVKYPPDQDRMRIVPMIDYQPYTFVSTSGSDPAKACQCESQFCAEQK